MRWGREKDTCIAQGQFDQPLIRTTMRRLIGASRCLAQLSRSPCQARLLQTSAATRLRLDPCARPVRRSDRQRVTLTSAPPASNPKKEEEKEPESLPLHATTASPSFSHSNGTTAAASQQQHDSSNPALHLSSFPLVAPLVSALRSRLHIHSLTPVQAAVLPHALARSHIVARSHTGTGKTLAFLIPLLNSLLSHPTPRTPFTCRMLILQPTRELTLQTLTTLQSLIAALPAGPTSLSTAAVYGGAPFPAQEKALAAGVHILCATPGRLLDLMARRSLSVKRVDSVVLDECDEMLRCSFLEDVETILKEMTSATTKQLMMFSATTPSWLRRISRRYMRDGETVWLDLTEAAERPVVAEGIKHQSMVAPVDWSERASVIARLVQQSTGRVLVFLPSQHDCTVLASHPALSSLSLPLHGGLTQTRREEVMSAFRANRVQCLLATDVLARGVDVELELVVHAYMPEDAEGYVHRSGRTGRAGRQGRCVLLYSAKERPMVRVLGDKLGLTFEEVTPAALTSPQPAEHEADMTEAEIADRMTATLESSSTQPTTSPYLSAARTLLEQHGPLVLATLMRSLWSRTQPPTERSLLTGIEGYICLHVKGSGLTKDSVTQRLNEWLSAASAGKLSASELRVGRMDFIADGVLVDVDVQTAGVLLGKRSESEVARCVLLPAELWDEKRTSAALQFRQRLDSGVTKHGHRDTDGVEAADGAGETGEGGMEKLSVTEKRIRVGPGQGARGKALVYGRAAKYSKRMNKSDSGDGIAMVEL